MRILGSEKRLLLNMISFMVVIIFLHIIYYSTKLIPNKFFHDIRLTIYDQKWSDEDLGLGENMESGPYLIKTKDCSIPETPLFPANFEDDWRIDKIPDCSYEIKNFLTMDEDEFVTFFPREVDEMCCLQEIIPNRTKYSLSKCNDFNAGTTLSVHDKEMFAVTCNKSINVDATFPIKPKVQAKLDFWKNQFENQEQNEWTNIQKRPPNILILMVDSVSRLHAHRSIPKTLSLLKELNFMEFKGYHSVGSNTLLNLIPMLLGQTLNEVRETCSPNWTSPFDTCPFIWNKFENYITNFIEDGEGSFSWGGQGGFKSPPTDYNIPQLFQALRHLRLKSFSPSATWFTQEMYADCVSSESIPEFVLRYTKRFITKFSDVPFFSFSFLAYPFHEHLYSLAGFDESLHDFFQAFSSMTRLDSESENIFDNTLILFLSDHGDRTSEHSSTVEGFIERSLPLFYMKLPKIFQEEFSHQSFWINAVKNTKRLITPWDIHETLLHSAQLFQPASKSSGSTSQSLGDLSIQSQNDDRSSLFHVISANRDCSTVNIPAQTCVCDTMMMINEEDETKLDLSTKRVGESKVKVMGRKNPLILQNTVVFLSNELNRMVKNSKYHQVCRTWTTDPSKILIFRQMNDRWIDSKSDNETEYFVSFSAHPGDAKFEGRLLISNELKIQETFNIQTEERKQHHNNDNINLTYDIKLVGSLSRVNSYRNQSFCIPFETDFDKEMKQFCVCKTGK